jgi:hypothetical protein
MKLLDDCGRWFPELSSRAPALSANGEMAFEFDPTEVGFRRSDSCNANTLIFLQRGAASGLLPVNAEEAADRLKRDFLNLPECFTGYDAMLDRVAAQLARQGTYVYGFDTDPTVTAERLDDLLNENRSLSTAAGRL